MVIVQHNYREAFARPELFPLPRDERIDLSSDFYQLPFASALEIDGHIKPGNPEVTLESARRGISYLANDQLSHKLPNPTFVVNNELFKQQFGWDSKDAVDLCVLKFRQTKDRKYLEVAKGIVENYGYEYILLGHVPNATDRYRSDRTHPPAFWSASIRAVLPVLIEAEGEERALEWLKATADADAAHMMDVWIEPKARFNHRAEGYENTPARRYGNLDVDKNIYATYAESGMDVTIGRFQNRPQDFIPIDLMCFIQKECQDLADFYTMLGETDTLELWQKKADEYKAWIQENMWNEELGMMADIDVKKAGDNKHSDYQTLAAYIALWADITTEDQTTIMATNIREFDSDLGLMITGKHSQFTQPKKSVVENAVTFMGLPPGFVETFMKLLEPGQWDNRNVWPLYHGRAIRGLVRNGYISEAIQIMQKNLPAEASYWHNNNHRWPEKLVPEDENPSYHYKDQEGENGLPWTRNQYIMDVLLLQALYSFQDGKIDHIPQELYA